MTLQAEPPGDLAGCIQQLSVALQEHIRVIDLIIAVAIGKAARSPAEERKPIRGPVAQVLPMFLLPAGSSSNTLVRLSDAPGLQTRDCYSIARSVIELSVNVCYVLAKGGAAAERALRHARQKAFRDLARDSQIAGHAIRARYLGAPDVFNVPEVEAQMKEFTSRDGREKGWVDLSIDDRISEVGAAFGEPILGPLHFARFMVYRHSSEILHGTLFGALHFLGITSPPAPPRDPKEMADFIGQQHMLVLLAVNLALSAVVDSFHAKFGFLAAHELSTAIVKSLGQIPYLKDQRPKADMP